MDTAVLRQSLITLNDSFGPDLAPLAAMSYIVKRSVRVCAEKRGLNAEGMLKLFDECIDCYLIEHDLHPNDLARVVSVLDEDLAPDVRGRDPTPH